MLRQQVLGSSRERNSEWICQSTGNPGSLTARPRCPETTPSAEAFPAEPVEETGVDVEEVAGEETEATEGTAAMG